MSNLPAYVVTLVKIACIVAGAYCVERIGRWLIHRFERRIAGGRVDAAAAPEQKRAKTLGAVLRTTTTVITVVVAALMVLEQASVRIGPLVAAAGIGGVALGFGAQNLVRDALNGFFILSESHYDVGDLVEIAGVRGTVEGLGLRTTVLRDDEGRRHVVPNGEIKVSSNLTKGFSRFVTTLPVAHQQDVDKVLDTAARVVEEMRADEAFSTTLLSGLQVLSLEYGDQVTNIKVFVQTAAGRHWDIGREFLRRLQRALDPQGISLPHRPT